MRADSTNPEMFEALVREHQGLVFRTLTRFTGAGAHVEDLAQEVFLRLYKALPYFRGDATVATYLYRITYNVAQDEWKRRRKERTHVAETPAFVEEDEVWLENFAGDANAGEHARSPEQRMVDAELQESVDAALGTLSEVERAVLVLYHQEDCSYEGIAAALEMPINTVRTHLHRGRKKLGERLRGGEGMSQARRVLGENEGAGAGSVTVRRA
ncbi:sigma-70 family RNA polymerase sigma factor [Granulicella sp. 5B5]|uniref:RNA polymerase sigma factor n=1 Tax=Granulicella sp. 5B5 TaxID=1617967 RepID=UPI0015F4EC40|nr:sigma-70 family RNA polymerase sigma factor [Granulicella sp. 5B5]QMV18565.1 sigma-70 family RNA polymerase sigma factor [Granulicella sp. 5B5]